MRGAAGCLQPAASACRVVRSTPPPANTNPSRSRNATALCSIGPHACLSMAICCNMHARTHAHPWRLLLFFLGTMASAASFVRSGAMRVLRREDRGQETSNGHQQLAFHARTARRGLCQDLRGAWSSQRTLPWPHLLSLATKTVAGGRLQIHSSQQGHHFVFD